MLQGISEDLTMPSGKKRSRFDVTIPGQSLTKPPKQYPWENPPQYTNQDEVIDFYMNKFENDETLFGLFAMLESGIPVTTIVTSMVMHGFSEGLYTPDLGVLVGEDIARIIMLIADEADIDYKVGEKGGVSQAIKSAVKLKESIDEREATFMPKVDEKIEELKDDQPKGGLMAPKAEPMETE